jgi:hypothetical protein
VATEEAKIQRRKWNNGFFSIGSMFLAMTRSATRLGSVSSRWSLTPQMPLRNVGDT